MATIEKKSGRKPMSPNKNNQTRIRIGTVHPVMFFRTLILFCTLLVATVAILKDVQGVEVWSFLGSVAICAALTNQPKQ